MIIYLSLLVAIVGAFMFYAASKAETKEIGKISFGVGLLAFLIRVTPEALKIIP